MKNVKNHVQLIGHLGADPEVKEIGTDKKLVRMRLATNQSYKNAEGEYEQKTQWHTLVAWDRTGERMAEQLSKGSFVMVQGSIDNHSWKNDQGETRYATNIKVQNYYQLESKVAAEAT